MAERLGEAVLDLRTRDRGLAPGIDRAERRAERLGRTFDAVARRVGALAIAASAMFGGGALVATIADFDSSMSRVAAITRATDAELAALRATASELGNTTEFSAAQAADGLSFLAMAGFDAQQAIAAIPAVLDLATASGMGLAEAADTTSNIMSGFGIEAENAAGVADILAAASSRSNTNVSQLGQAMSTAAPIMAALGIGIEDTAAALGVLADAGLQGERGGTALRGVIASLAAPTDMARDALANYGLTVADVDPASRSLTEIFTTLRAAGLSTADAMNIFGREAATGALVLTAASERVGEFGQELRDVDGAAQAMAATMRDNLRGDIQSLGSAISGLIIALGEAGLTAALRAVTQFLTATARVIAENVRPVLAGLAVIVAGLAASQIPALIGMISRLPALFTAAGAAVAAFNGILTLTGTLVTILGGPLGVLFALLGAGAAALVLFRRRLGETPPTIEAVREAQDLLNQAMGRFAGGAPGAGAEAIAYARNLETTAAAALAAAEAVLAFNEARLEGVSPEALEAMQAMPGWESNPMRGVLEQQAQARAQIEENLIALENARRTLQALQIQQATAGAAVNGNLFDDAGETLTELTVTVEGLGDAFEGAGDTAAEAAEEALTGWAAVADALSGYAESARNLGQEIGKSLTGAFRNAESAMGRFVETGKFDFRSLVTSMLADLARLASRRFIFGPLANLLSGFTASIGKSGGALASIFSGFFASGGTIPNGTFGIVGENGPEPVYATAGGVGVMPNSSLRQMQGVTNVTVNIQTPDPDAFRRGRGQWAADIGRAVSRGQRNL